MTSREKILNAIPAPANAAALPEISPAHPDRSFSTGKFMEVLKSIGGAGIEMPSYSGVREYIYQHFSDKDRILSGMPEFAHQHPFRSAGMHPLDNVEVAVIKGRFAVAENAAIWITDEELPDRVLPFICQHLIVVVDSRDVVGTMHDAYARIGNDPYDFGTFIAGPSKTADIEQALVLGAHGPKSMTVFLVENSG
jgi:L-lactate dehydrogenase complex protein LldG